MIGSVYLAVHLYAILIPHHAKNFIDLIVTHTANHPANAKINHDILSHRSASLSKKKSQPTKAEVLIILVFDKSISFRSHFVPQFLLSHSLHSLEK